MNTIGKIQFHFQMQNEDFARELYRRWDSFFTSCVERTADEVIEKYNSDDEYIEIDQLELDLGEIEDEKLDEQFSIRFRQKLDEALSQCLYGATTKQTVKRVSRQENAFDLLCRFLLHGTLSWSAQGVHKDIHSLFLKVIQENGAAFKQFLQTYGHYTSLQQRLIYQFNDPELEKGIVLLAPSTGEFLISYIRFLRDKQKATQGSEITGSNYRDAVWLVVYAYLLTQRSSYFDKKSFVAQTIMSLAGKYNQSYDSLLYFLTLDLDVFREKMTIPLELVGILDELKKELSEKKLNGSSFDAAQFYKTLFSNVKRELAKQLTESSREGLFRILEHHSTCRSFLQQLSEPEIQALLPIVAPQDSKIVLDVARYLDRQQEEGELQGKADGEFRLLKWQIIFPLLLDRKGTAFNRKQFVLNVLQKVAAHYNMDVVALLRYFVNDVKVLIWADRELQQIFLTLWQEYGSQVVEKTEHEGNLVDQQLVDFLLNDLLSIELLNSQQIKNVLRLLANNRYREKIVDNTNEEERSHLIKLLYPKEHMFILSYLQGLDRAQLQTLPEAEPVGKSDRLKWTFLFTVFSEMTADNFNRIYFVRRVLQQTAAHYNLNYLDLLFYLSQHRAMLHLPYDLEQLLDMLYREEQEHWLTVVMQIQNEEDKYTLLASFYPEEKEFLHTYLYSLDYLFDKGNIQGKLSGNFKKLKWQFVFELLLKYKGVSSDKRQFVSASLTKMAAHFHLTREELLAYYIDILEAFTNTSTSYSGILKVLYELRDKTIELELKENEEENPSSIVTKKEIEKVLPKQDNEMKSFPNEEKLSTYLPNAGMVLLSPYFSRLFSMLKLTDNNAFVTPEAQLKAIFILQQIVYGKTEFPEYDLLLNKLLVGLENTVPVPAAVELTVEEKETIDSMLHAVLQHWNKLKNTSVLALQETFLQRQGKLEESEDGYLLTVEEKSYDMLLDSLPWNFRIIKYFWMQKPVHVKWR